MNKLQNRWREIRQLLTIGWPIIVAQVSQTGMGFVDTLMSGRYGSQDLAAIAIGSSLWLPVFLAFEGVLMATTPLVAHQVGAGKLKQTRDIFAQGCVIALALGFIAIILLHNTLPVLAWMSVEPALAEKTARYLAAISWGFPAIMLYQVIRSFSEGFGKTHPIMIIAIFALLANIPLNYLFIYGKLGLPELGGVGCGWASSLVMWLTLGAGLIYIKTSHTFKPCELFAHRRLPGLQQLNYFLRLGLPIGLTLLIEVSMFAIIALLLADLGETIVAAHQITISFTGMVFMIPLSIAMALTIRIGHRLGGNNKQGACYSASTGVLITLICATLSSTLMFLFAAQIATLYTSDQAIILIAAELITIAAVFQFSDAIQVACAGALRGYRDTTIPLGMVFVAYWMIGLPLGFILARKDWIVPAMGPQGFWISLVIALTLAAIMLGARLF
ncbi:MAG: MATE family efflux transporter, partial [Pontibacterium sp.]